MAGKDTYLLVIEGLKDLVNLDSVEPEILRAAKLALNGTIDYARAQAGKAIRRQVNFPASYLTGAEGKLKIAEYATEQKLSARISAQRRPTSLARFARPPLTTGGNNRNKAGVRVEVKPGRSIRLKNAFLVKLRRGAATTDTQNNLGLAVRLKPGTRPSKTSKAREIFPNVWLMYGPSVDQAFINRKYGGVADDLSPEIQDYLSREFLRLVDVKL